jgi:hypothetical protein
LATWYLLRIAHVAARNEKPGWYAARGRLFHFMERPLLNSKFSRDWNWNGFVGVYAQTQSADQLASYEPDRKG